MKHTAALDARVAFLSGQLEWVKGDKAILVHTKQDGGGKLFAHSHEEVVIEDVVGVTQSGAPIFVVRNDFGEQSNQSSEFLTTWERLMFDERGGMSNYARQVAERIARSDQRLARGYRTPLVGTATIMPL